MKQLSILGSTGSIGRQCLSVVEALPERFGLVALAAGANLKEDARTWAEMYVYLTRKLVD